jgi:hypothetical protein
MEKRIAFKQLEVIIKKGEVVPSDKSLAKDYLDNPSYNTSPVGYIIMSGNIEN